MNSQANNVAQFYATRNVSPLIVFKGEHICQLYFLFTMRTNESALLNELEPVYRSMPLLNDALQSEEA